MRKARSEKLKESDLSTDPLVDIIKRANAQREDNATVFIQKIDHLPFSVHLFTYASLDILHTTLKKQKYVRLHLDATGGIVTSPVGAPVLHHTIILPIKSNDENKKSVLLNLAEMLTVDNTSFNLAHFLRHFKVKFSHRCKIDKVANAFVTDKCFANINAICDAFNNMTIKEYLKFTYEVFIGERELNYLDSLVMIFLCSSHYTNNLKKDIYKFFPKTLAKKDKIFICALIGNLMKLETLRDIDDYIKCLIKVFCSKEVGCDEAFQHINKMMRRDLSEIENEFDHLEIDENLIEDNDSDVIYKSSRFFLRYEFFLNECCDSNATHEVNNRFYNPDYMRDFFKKHIAYLPFLSKFFTSFNCKENFKRPNQGSVEGNFGGVKNWIRKDLKVELGHLKCGRYIDALQKKISTDQKEIKFNIPDKHLSRKVKNQKQPLQTTIQTSEEGWRGKPKTSSTLFFNPENVLRNTGKYQFKKIIFKLSNA